MSGATEKKQNRRLRTVWVLLCIFALGWGMLTGLAFAIPGFWLTGPSALFGCLATLVFIATVSSIHKQHS